MCIIHLNGPCWYFLKSIPQVRTKLECVYNRSLSATLKTNGGAVPLPAFQTLGQLGLPPASPAPTPKPCPAHPGLQGSTAYYFNNLRQLSF